MSFISNIEAYEEESLRTILHRIENKLDMVLEGEVVITDSAPDKEAMARLIKEMKKELGKRK